ncbi:MAG: glycine cleavage T C-terminal barrel domain-containing protein [Candidatus Acidiferrum sp.]
MDSIAPAISTPLAEFHREHGAKIGTWFGCALPDDFGDWRREYAFARETVALLDKNYRCYLDFTGPDRVRYLNAILTNNIKGLAEHHGAISLFLSPQGHIQAEIESYAFPDRIFCVSFAMIRQRLIEGLDKFIIMDDVTLTDVTEQYGTLALEGPGAGAAATKLLGGDVRDLGEMELHECMLGNLSCSVSKRTIGSIKSVEFLTQRSQLQPLWNLLLAAAHGVGGGAAGYTALNVVRLEQGVPWFGYDFGEKQIPHEAGLETSHISYTKGCYTGQEIVERVRSRGQVNRSRVSLKFDLQVQPAAGTPLLFDGREIGQVTRAGFSPAANAYIGMGYVRREKSAPGSALEVSAGGVATVYAPPSSVLDNPIP